VDGDFLFDKKIYYIILITNFIVSINSIYLILFQGGCIGLVCGLIMNIWISFGTAITKTSVNIKSPISVDGCIWKYSNTTTLITSSTTSMAPSSVETVSTTHIFDKYEYV
jgi:hypothetical protein